LRMGNKFEQLKEKIKKINKDKQIYSGAICGGIISESMWDKAVKEGNAMGLLMCVIMPDDKYELYWKLKEEGKDKEAEQILKKYAWSVL